MAYRVKWAQIRAKYLIYLQWSTCLRNVWFFAWRGRVSRVLSDHWSSDRTGYNQGDSQRIPLTCLIISKTLTSKNMQALMQWKRIFDFWSTMQRCLMSRIPLCTLTPTQFWCCCWFCLKIQGAIFPLIRNRRRSCGLGSHGCEWRRVQNGEIELVIGSYWKGFDAVMVILHLGDFVLLKNDVDPALPLIARIHQLWKKRLLHVVWVIHHI